MASIIRVVVAFSPAAVAVFTIASVVTLIGGVAVFMYLRSGGDNDIAAAPDSSLDDSGSQSSASLPHKPCLHRQLYVVEPTMGHALSFAPANDLDV